MRHRRRIGVVVAAIVAVVLFGCAAPRSDDAATGSGASTPTAPAAAATSAAPAPAAPVVEVRTVTETQTIPYPRRTVNDPTLAKGTTRLKTRGVDGSKTVTYEVTFTDGVPTAKRAVSEVVTKQPVAEVTAIGTKAPSGNCDPNYTPCVPIASDVDCLGGSGNGPAYVKGPVYVIGTDIYDLDADNDGIGCE